MSVITAVTAQNSVGVQGVENLPPAFVAQQLRSVLEDFGADAAKCGMLSARPSREPSRRCCANGRIPNLRGRSRDGGQVGIPLLRPRCRQALITHILPLALVVTPNLPEAEALRQVPVADRAGMEDGAAHQGPRPPPPSSSRAATSRATRWISGTAASSSEFSVPRVDSSNTHGTGCTLSAAIAAGLALGHALPDAVARAKAYVTRAIREGFQAGRGVGQLRHFLAEW
jgi:hydroxymethylpyrimidine/phosphomethylpyrimidine kinase